MIEKKAFPSFHFSTCGKNGMTGPSQDDADKCYHGTSVSVQIIDSGTQKWIVPLSGLYIITAAGASGIQCGTPVNGKGVIINSYFRLNFNFIIIFFYWFKNIDFFLIATIKQRHLYST